MSELEKARFVFRAAASALLDAAGDYSNSVVQAIDLLARALTSGHRVLVFGNGGSAADAMHIAAELMGRFNHDRAALPVLGLSTNPAFLTAWSNDVGFDSVFARQIEALGQPGDVAWGISTSGASANVVGALRRARELGLGTVGLTGHGGGEMAGYCDVLICAPALETPRVQEVHVATYHVICAAIERRLLERAEPA